MMKERMTVMKKKKKKKKVIVMEKVKEKRVDDNTHTPNRNNTNKHCINKEPHTYIHT